MDFVFPLVNGYSGDREQGDGEPNEMASLYEAQAKDGSITLEWIQFENLKSEKKI